METETRKSTTRCAILPRRRVILPGLQALFGFQRITVFSDRFDDLAAYAKTCQLPGLAMVIVAVAMVMTRSCDLRAARRLWFVLPARGPGRDARRGEQLHR